MNRYFKKSLALILILLFLSSCDKGCVESYQFDTEVVTVDSKPVSDGIDGQYNNISGGQSVAWHETGLRANGEPIVISIGGAWTAWSGGWQGVKNEDGLNAMQQCQMCFMKDDSTNCLCAPGQIPKTYDEARNPTNSNCAAGDQNDKDKCTCTTQQGSISDDGVYSFAVDYQDKQRAPLTPDEQKECKFDKGLGLYIALFGTDGQTTPQRAYHLYSYTSLCDLNKTPCVDADGHDATRYLYTSPNNKIFVKDDKGTPGEVDDEYHKPGELIKFRISDRYYSDNYGAYDLIFMGGVMKNEDKGLLEYIVGTFEDVLLGKRAEPCIGNCARTGGVIEYMYNSIVKDSTFIFLIQLLLILYITLFGMFSLAGVVEINKKELMKRVLKIGLIIFFTSPTSWSFYNQFVVGLFKNSMDTILSMFMGFSDQAFFTSSTGEAIQSNSMVSIAQAERAVSASNATRFSYVDLTIKMLFSDAIAKKTWSLFFGTWFGILYIPAIYGLIFFFTYTVLTAALVYIVSMIKLLFVIALGPLFIIASLFSQTEGIFKRWITFMAARAIEIIVMFVVLYTFLVLINNGFKDLFSYRSCVEPYNIGLFSLNIVKVYTSRSFVGWISILLKIGALIMMLRLILQKLPVFAASMVQVGGQGAAGLSDAGTRQGVNNSAFGIANDVMGKLFDVGKVGVESALPFVADKAHRAAGFALDKAGISDKWNNLKEKIPVRNPISIVRDMTIDGAIKTATANAKAKGLTGAALDKEIRQQTFNAIYKSTTKGSQIYSDSDVAGMTILGIDAQSIAKRLDDKLIKDPLKKIIKEEAAKLKNQDGRLVPVGEDMRNQLREKVAERAAAEMSADPKTLEKYMANMKGLMAEQSELSSSEAARKFAGRPELEGKFLEYLKAKQFQEKLASDKARQQGGLLGFGDYIKRGFKSKIYDSTKNVEESFIRRAKYEEGRKSGSLMDEAANRGKGFGIVSRINFLDKYADKLKIAAKEKPADERGRLDRFLAKGTATNFAALGRDKEISAYEDYLFGGYQKERDRIKAEYDAQIEKFKNNTGILSKSEIEKNRKEAEELAQKKLQEYSRRLGVHLNNEHKESPGDRDFALADAAAPAAPAAPVPDDDKMAKVQESLNKIASDGAADKTAEQKDKDRADEIEQLKKNLKEHYAEQKQSLETKVANLKAKHAEIQRKLSAIKSHVVKTPADEAEIQQLEFEEQRCSVQLTVAEGHKQRVSDSLAKVD